MSPTWALCGFVSADPVECFVICIASRHLGTSVCHAAIDVHSDVTKATRAHLDVLEDSRCGFTAGVARELGPRARDVEADGSRDGEFVLAAASAPVGPCRAIVRWSRAL